MFIGSMWASLQIICACVNICVHNDSSHIYIYICIIYVFIQLPSAFPPPCHLLWTGCRAPLNSLWVPVGFFRSPLVASWAPPGYLLGSPGSRWLPLASFWTPLGSPWVLFGCLLGSIWYLWGFIGGPVGHHLEAVAGELHYLMGTGSCKTPSPPDQVEPEMLPNPILADVGAQNV